MESDPVSARYAQALFEKAKADGELDSVLKEMELLGGIIEEHAGLRLLLINPRVSSDEKTQVLNRLMRGSWSKLVGSFIHMSISLGRAEHIPEIVKALKAAVDEDQDRVRVTLRCAHPVPKIIVERLRVALERKEGKRIAIESEVAKDLIGGIQIQLGNRLIDGSIHRQLLDLRNKLKAVRVH